MRNCPLPIIQFISAVMKTVWTFSTQSPDSGL
jgi:hypothetical protein